MSRGAHGEIGDNVYQRLVEAHREVWFGSDGSGLIKSARIRWSFFTEEQRTRWEAAKHPAARERLSPALDLFAPGCLPGHRAMLSKLPTDPAELAADLGVRRKMTLHRIGELMGEALVPEALRRALHQVAAQLPGAEMLATSTDELGRRGHAIARVERGRRVELTFDPDSLELLGEREVLTDHEPSFAPAGALVGWKAFLSREIVGSLPVGTPPVPSPPCSPAGSGRGTLIETGFLLGTGYFEDLAPHLETWRANGVITDVQYAALNSDLRSDR